MITLPLHHLLRQLMEVFMKVGIMSDLMLDKKNLTMHSDLKDLRITLVLSEK